MSDIMIKPDALSAGTLRKTISAVKKAYQAAANAEKEGSFFHYWTWGGSSHYLFVNGSYDNVIQATNLLKNALDRLEALSIIMQSGPDGFKDIDRSFRSDIRSWRKSGKHNAVLWTASGGGGTAEETVIESEEEKYINYINTEKKINEKVPVGQKQETERSGSGLCTYSATTTLLRRREAADGRDPSFSFGDVHRANEGNGQVESDGIWPDSRYAFGRKYTTNDGEKSYQMAYEDGPSSVKQVVELLKQHPEGIMIYSPSCGGYDHAIVITDYEIREDGSIQFYADDPVNNANSYYTSGRVPIEQTWLYTQNKNIIETSVRVAYLE